MTFKLRNYEINSILEVLGEISQQDVDDIKTSYRIGKIIKTLSSHHEDYNESRKKLLNKYAKKDKDGHFVKAQDGEGNEIPDSVLLENQEKFNEEIIKILNDSVEVQIAVELTIEELFDAGVKLKPHKVVLLEPLLEGVDVKGGA